MVDAAAYVPFNARRYGGHTRLLRLAGNPQRVLDVGCSSGYLAGPLAERGATVVGIENDPLAAAAARNVCGEVLEGDVETMEFSFTAGSFDLVLCGDLIEHLSDPGAFLRRVRPLLATDGRLVIATPNVANWAMRLGLLVGRWRYTERGILDRTHRHLFTRKTLTETVTGAGFLIEEWDLTAPVPLIGTPRVERLAHAIAGAWPSLLAYQFILAARPRALGSEG